MSPLLWLLACGFGPQIPFAWFEGRATAHFDDTGLTDTGLRDTAEPERVPITVIHPTEVQEEDGERHLQAGWSSCPGEGPYLYDNNAESGERITIASEAKARDILTVAATRWQGERVRFERGSTSSWVSDHTTTERLTVRSAFGDVALLQLYPEDDRVETALQPLVAEGDRWTSSARSPASG